MSTYGEYNIAGCNALLILSLRCPVCRRDVTPPMLALGEPYHCVVHRQCAPHFAFDGQYPHDLPIAHMLNRTEVLPAWVQPTSNGNVVPRE